jgi:tetratricopeptide (TPR) repeat protein
MEKARVNNADVPKLASIQEAIALWSRLRPERADQVQGLVWRGRAHRITDEHAAAVADFRKALEMDPDNLHAKLALAFTLVQEAPEEATEHLEAVRNRLPDSRQLLFALATLRHGLGQLDQAREILDTILAAHPQDVASLVEKSLVDLDERQLVPAEHRLQLALRLNPNIPDVYLALSRCMLLAGRTDEAKEYQDRFLQLEAKRKKREENSTGKLPGSPRPEPEPESEIQNARNFFAALDYETFTGDLEERKKAISEALEAGTISNDAAIDGATRINSTLTQIKLVTKVATAGVAIKILTPREANETGDKLKEVTQILTKARAERSKLTSEQGYREAVAAISRIQVDLAREFYSKPDKPGDIDYAKFRAAMEMFNNFGLFAGPLQSALEDEQKHSARPE